MPFLPKRINHHAERDKYLHKAMGGCWHEWEPLPDKANKPRWGVGKYHRCKHCGAIHSQNLSPGPQFSQPAVMLRLLRWCRRRKWWPRFVKENGILDVSGYEFLEVTLLEPNKLADSVYLFLVNKEEV